MIVKRLRLNDSRAVRDPLILMRESEFVKGFLLGKLVSEVLQLFRDRRSLIESLSNKVLHVIDYFPK